MAVAANHHILWFDIAMNDAGGVGLFKRTRDLNPDTQHLGQIHRRTRQATPQRFTVDELSRDIVASSFIAHFVNRQYVWMIQRRCRISLLIESGEAIAIPGKFLG